MFLVWNQLMPSALLKRVYLKRRILVCAFEQLHEEEEEEEEYDGREEKREEKRRGKMW